MSELHTKFGTNRLVLNKGDLDDAFKDKRIPESSKVEMLFGSNSDRYLGKYSTWLHTVATCFVSVSSSPSCSLFSSGS